MNKYELYVIDEDGKLHPTGIWARGHRQSDIEGEFRKPIKEIDQPCAILVSTLKSGVNDK